MRLTSLLFIFLLVRLHALAGVNKLFLVNSGEEFPETPIHGRTAFQEWLGKDRLAFAKGHTYRLWIDYSNQLPATGTIVSTTKFVIISGCKRKLNGYEFTLTVDKNAKRGATFSMGFKSGSSHITNVIECQVVEIGRLDAMVIQDTTNTTFAGLFSKSTYWTFHYTHGTGPRVWSFYGKALDHARFDFASDSGLAKGLQFYTDLAVQTDTSFDIVFTVSNEITGEKGSMRDDILTRIYDAAADRRFEWITYKYALPSVLENSTDKEGELADPSFELTPGNRKSLCNTCRGYHRFRETLYQID